MPFVRHHKPAPLKLSEKAIASIRGSIDEQRTPSIAQKAVNATKAVGRVVEAVVRRQPVKVSDEERDRRLTICRGCEYWNEGGNIGLGECKHPQCGCTRFKHGLSTERCPINQW